MDFKAVFLGGFLCVFVFEPNVIVSVRDSFTNAAKAVAGSVGVQITYFVIIRPVNSYVLYFFY